MGLDGKDFSRLGKSAQRQILNKLAEQSNQKRPKTATIKQGGSETASECNSIPKNLLAVRTAKNGKESKYRAKPTARIFANGVVHVFDSKKEAERYDELKAMLDIGEISDLRIQPQFTLIEGYIASDGTTVQPEKYKADFSYWQKGNYVVEDVKSKATRTQLYLVKKKQMQDKFGITIQEV